MFEVGDAVVHPVCGAGVVTEIEELQRGGSSRQYYRIKLLNQKRTSLMIPVKKAASIGLRPPIQASRLDQVECVLQEEADALPTDYRERHQLLTDRIQSGDILQLAGAVRDIYRRNQRKKGLPHRERRMFRRAVGRLAGEIASAEGITLAQAKARVRAWLRADLLPDEERGSEGERQNRSSFLSDTERKGVSILRRVAGVGADNSKA
jgi:CarD family transcriptional regulator